MKVLLGAVRMRKREKEMLAMSMAHEMLQLAQTHRIEREAFLKTIHTCTEIKQLPAPVQTNKETPTTDINIQKMLLLFNLELIELNLEASQLIENSEEYQMLRKTHSIMKDKLKWINLQLCMIENEDETGDLRRQWEIAHRKINKIEHWLNLSKTALAMNKRCKHIFTDLFLLNQMLNSKDFNTIKDYVEEELESINDRIDQVHQHITSMQERSFTVHDLNFLYQQCLAVLEALYENVDEKAERSKA